MVPGSSPLEIIYEQKILNGDNTGKTAFPASKQCNTFWANYYAINPFGTAVNDDITYLRLASTADGINFKDLGPLMGLNDPTTVSFTGTRWLATARSCVSRTDGMDCYSPAAAALTEIRMPSTTSAMPSTMILTETTRTSTRRNRQDLQKRSGAGSFSSPAFILVARIVSMGRLAD